MLWDIIRDFFVEHIFGGINSFGDTFGGVVSAGEWVEGSCFPGINGGSDICVDGHYETVWADQWYFSIGGQTISLGDWLSTMSTIIVLIGGCFLLYCVIRYFFRLSSGLIRGR